MTINQTKHADALTGIINDQGDVIVFDSTGTMVAILGALEAIEIGVEI